MEVFMDEFLVFGNSFRTCLSHLDKMLKRCEDTNLCLNWEKSHFMVKEGIILNHKISKNGIEVDKAKVYVIAKLHHLTTVKGIRSFLGHAGFYRRFIQDFSKIAPPMTRLLEKDTLFFFFKERIKAFQTLKKKLTEAPILVASDWGLTFELMSTVGQTQNVYAARAYNQGGNNQGRNQFFQGASHGQNPSPAYQALAYQAPGNQALVHQASIPQPQVVTTTEFRNYMKANDFILKNIPLPSNTITNPKGELKAITTRSGLVLDGPSVPMPHPFTNPKEDERVEETLTDPEIGEFTIKVPLPLVQKAEPPSQRNNVVHQRDPLHPNIPYPSRTHKQKQQDKDKI
nr:reverse transcriptase domain-containing protein [Tanacetum cinerariifolium]